MYKMMEVSPPAACTPLVFIYSARKVVVVELAEDTFPWGVSHGSVWYLNPFPKLQSIGYNPKGGVPEARLTRTARLNLSTQTLGFVGRGLRFGFNPCAKSKSFSVWGRSKPKV